MISGSLIDETGKQTEETLPTADECEIIEWISPRPEALHSV